MSSAKNDNDFIKNGKIYEYGSAANPTMPPIPVLVHPPELHQSGPTRIIPFDLSKHLVNNESSEEDTPSTTTTTPCTSPNLMASFVRIQEGDTISTKAIATSQAFYIIRGNGTTTVSEEHSLTVCWSTGDMIVLPSTIGEVIHTCTSSNDNDDTSQSKYYDGAAIYWIHDQPLLDYLGVVPSPK